MKTSKYIKLDQEAIKRDYPEVYQKYEGTHMVTPVAGTDINLQTLKSNESAIYGDGRSFYFKLTKV